MDFDVEPRLFYGIILSFHGQKNLQEYLYVGKGYLLPTNKPKKKTHFLMISL